jgi:ABC-type multidrug transport system fused ATPase/permease subunit
MGRAEHERRRLLREGEGVVDAELASARVSGVFSGLVALVEVAGVLAVVAFGTWAIQDERLTIGGLLAFLTYLTQLLRPIGDLSQLAASLLAASAGGERVLELLDRQPLVRERPGAVTLERVRGEIEFDEVTFAYPDVPEPVLRELSLSVSPGEVVALTGPSGCGKSTLARLLLRFADPQAGRVSLDGYDLRGLTLDSVRDNVALLLQETLLFDASVRDNIAFGRLDATEAEIEAAARAAGAHEFVSRLPDGYDTRVGQRGRRLSGGQRRRVEIARTLLRDVPVVVLDEPTTGLDDEAAAGLVDPLRALLRGRSGLVITHDQRLLACADRVVRLGGGRADPAGRAESAA